MKEKINYSTQQFKWAKEIMEEKDVNIFDINWNKFKTKEEIERFIDMLEEGLNVVLKDSDINE